MDELTVCTIITRLMLLLFGIATLIAVHRQVWLVKCRSQIQELMEHLKMADAAALAAQARVLKLVADLQEWTAGVAPAQKKMAEWRKDKGDFDRERRLCEQRVAFLERKLQLAHEAVHKALGEADRAVQLNIASVNETTREGNYTEYLALQEREKKLYVFLNTHFQDDADMGQAANTPLIDVACVVMLRQKMELAKARQG